MYAWVQYIAFDRQSQGIFHSQYWLIFYPAQVPRYLVRGDNIKFPLLFAGSHLEPQYHWFACSRSEDKVFMQQRGTIKHGIHCMLFEKVVASCKKL